MKPIKKAIRVVQQNKGLTLVEVLVVIAILSITVGMAGISISLLFSRDAERCVKSVDTMLETARMRTMSQEGEHRFILDTEQRVCQISPNEEQEKLPSRVNLSFSSAGVYDFSSNTKIEILFDKSTGKVKEIRADDIPVSIEDVNLLWIQAENGSGKRASVVIVTATGKHFVEYGT